MARVYASSVLPAPAAKVWARIRDFNGLPSWHPAIAESRIENGEPADKVGCVRDFRLRNGDRIRECLLGLSDYDMFCTYSILESPMGVENYVATLRLTPITDGDRTFCEWTAEFDCAPERESRARHQYRHRRLPGRLRCAQAAFRRLMRAESRPLNHHRRAGRPGLGAAARLQRPRPLASGRARKRDRARPSVRQGRLRAALRAARTARNCASSC